MADALRAGLAQPIIASARLSHPPLTAAVPTQVPSDCLMMLHDLLAELLMTQSYAVRCNTILVAKAPFPLLLCS